MSRFFAFLGLLALPLTYLGQQYSFIQYSIEEGLPQTQINAIDQDSKGFLWIGSFGGVSKFDGIEFENFSKADGLIDNLINCVLVDSEDNVWVGGSGGVSVISGASVTSYHLSGKLREASIRCLLIHEGYLYMGSRASGLLRSPLNSLSDTLRQVEQIGQSDLRIRDLNLFEGKVVLGTRDGVKQVVSDSLAPLMPELDGLNVSNLAARDAELWVSTYRSGVFKTAAGKIENFNDKGLLIENSRSIVIDQHGNPWVGARNGLQSLTEKGVISFNTSNGLTNSNIKVVFEDQEGNIWVGSDGGGLFKFSGERFVALTTGEGMTSNLVMSFAEDSGGIWISTYGGGISYKNSSGVTNYADESMLSHKLIWTSIVDSKGRVWFGTSNGLTIKDETGVHPFLLDEVVDNVRITSLLEHKGKVFIGHRLGLSVFDGDSVVNIESEASIIRAMFPMKNGDVIIGASNGIYRYGPSGQLKRERVEGDADLYPVHCFAPFDEDTYWVGNSNGLFMVDGGRATVFELGPSSGHNYINFLVKEDEQTLWAGTNHGVFEIEIESFFNDQELRFRNYTPADGIRSYETNLNSGFKSSNGAMWFGTIDGAIMFKRNENYQESTIPLPALNLTEVQLSLNQTDWRPYSEGYETNSIIPKGLELPHFKNHLTFHFIGISHSYPEQVKYRTMLEGFDSKWNPISKTPFITYSNLPPGNYIFRVQASLDEKDWSPERAFSFQIRTPFWQTWWFISLIAFAIILILLLIYRVRLQAEANKRKTESLLYKTRLMNLEQQSLNASMNRHFIFNALNSIQYYINRQDKLSANRYLSSFAKLIRKNLDSSSSPDNLVQLSEELERLDLYISLEHMRFQNKFDYEIKIDPKIETEAIRVPAMFLQPYVENSIWHGILPMKKPGKISIVIQQAEEEIRFIIQDNGIGIDKSLEKKSLLGSSHDSKGMKITSSRINVLRKITGRNIQVFGPFEVKNEEGESAGTRVEIVFPIEKNATFNKNSR